MIQLKKFSNPSFREKFLFFLPFLLLVLGLSTYPILRGIYLGFTNYKVGRGFEFNGLENYIQIYQSGYLITAFNNIIQMLVVSVVFIYLISLVLALLLSGRVWLRGFWRTLIIIPWAVHPIAKITIWKFVFNPVSGYLNYYLQELGIIDQYIAFLSNPTLAKVAIICVFVWGSIPFLTLTFLATLQQIPEEIIEAAMLDGASKLQAFRYITLPYLNQTTAISMSLIIVWIINDFPSQFVLTNGGPGSATLTPIVEAYRQGFRYGNLGYASAYGNMLILLVSAILFIYIRALNSRDRGVN